MSRQVGDRNFFICVWAIGLLTFVLWGTIAANAERR